MGLRRIPLREVAVLVRQELWRHYPPGLFQKTFFRVRIQRHAWGGWIDIEWTDGPAEDAVRAITEPYCGKRHDGSTDQGYHADAWLCAEHGLLKAQLRGHGPGVDGPEAAPCCDMAELVSMGADFIQLRRHDKEK